MNFVIYSLTLIKQCDFLFHLNNIIVSNHIIMNRIIILYNSLCLKYFDRIQNENSFLRHQLFSKQKKMFETLQMEK